MEDSPGNDGYPSMGQPAGLPQLPERPPKSNDSRPNNGSARHSKRLTLNFPINLAHARTDSASSSPGSMTPVTHSPARQSPALPADLGSQISFEEQDDGNSLLRAIASQERKVLELREELHNAESGLAMLKKQWTSSEKTRKRTEINLHAEPLLPLRSPDRPTEDSTHRRNQSIAGTPDSSAPSARLSRDLDRRHGMRTAATAGASVSTNGRRVFQGSHARTLSLLSAASDPAHRRPNQDPEHGKSDTTNERISRYPRAATLPSVDRSTESTFRTADSRTPATEDTPPQWQGSMPPPPSREALMRTGKQMALDLREGLWTFFDDIRQATVGDEAINGREARRLSPTSAAAARKRVSPNPNSRLSVQEARSARLSPSPSSRQGSSRRASSGKETKSTGIDASFWNEFGIDTPGQNGSGSDSNRETGNSSTNEGPNHSPSNIVNAETDADTWDWYSSTPQPKATTTAAAAAMNNSHSHSSSRSTLESKQQSPQTQASSPRTSAR